MDPHGKNAEIQTLQIQLPPDSELLIRVPFDEAREAATIRLVNSSGSADERVEVFGAPLHVDVQYRLLAGTVYTVFAWTAASLEIKGSPLLLRNTMRSTTRSITRPIVEYHCLTQERRAEADKSGTIGPITLVCGKNTLMKAAMARSLCSYAARAGWKPLLVDLNCGELQSVGIPGTVGAAVIEFPLAVDEVIAQTHVTSTFFVGTTECQHTSSNGEAIMSAQFTNYASALLNLVHERLQKHKGNVYASSGAVVIMPELRDNSAVNFITDVVQQLGVTNILTIGDDYLFHKLLSRVGASLSGLGIAQVDKISQSHLLGIAPPAEDLLPIKFNNYFLGAGSTILHPSQWAKTFDKLEVLQLRDDNEQVSLSNIERDALQGIVGCIAALFQVVKEGNPLTRTPVAFARVQSVDAVGVSFLTTSHYTFPAEKLVAVVGSVRWITSSA